MKKFFTLIAMAFMALSVNATEMTLWEGEALVNGWGNQPVFLSDTGTELRNAGALPGDVVRFYATAESEGWQVQLVEGHWGPVYAIYAGSPLTDADSGEPLNNEVVDLNAQGYFEFTLTEEVLEAAYTQKWWGGVFLLNGDGNVTVTKITIVTALDWETEAKNITFDDGGFIPASEFEGLNDKAKVKFTYNVSGELGSKKNWGIGRIGCNDTAGTDGAPSYVIATLSASDNGDLTFGCFYEDIKKALEVTPDGIKFEVWSFDDGAITATRVKVESFNVVSDGIDAVKTTQTENGAIYNLAGQRVDASYRGVVIMNGKKFIQK
jgi:hypothetical protein